MRQNHAVLGLAFQRFPLALESGLLGGRTTDIENNRYNSHQDPFAWQRWVMSGLPPNIKPKRKTAGCYHEGSPRIRRVALVGPHGPPSHGIPGRTPQSARAGAVTFWSRSKRHFSFFFFFRVVVVDVRRETRSPKRCCLFFKGSRIVLAASSKALVVCR